MRTETRSEARISPFHQANEYEAEETADDASSEVVASSPASGSTQSQAAGGSASVHRSDSAQEALDVVKQALAVVKSRRGKCTQTLSDLKSQLKDLRKDTDKLLKFQAKCMVTR